MLIAAAAATPIGIAGALPAFTHPLWLAWGVGVGVCSSVIPYVTDQLAMARLPRATFALMLAVLPAGAAGFAVLGQVPTVQDLAGIGLVIAGVALHQDHPPNSPHRAGQARRVEPTDLAVPPPDVYRATHGAVGVGRAGRPDAT